MMTTLARSLLVVAVVAFFPRVSWAVSELIFADGFEGPVDPASPVASSSDDGTPLTACLVAGSGARVLVWTDLRHTSGAPVRGAWVEIGGVPATPSAVQPGIYWREVTADAAPGAAALPVVATTPAGTVALALSVSLTHVGANTSSGGTGGCSPGDGNLRVRVVEAETGAGVAGASVIVGLSEAMPFEHNPDALFGGASTPASNLAVTDASGYASFYDYGSGLSGAVTTTAGEESRAYFTVADASASDLVLGLPLLHTPVIPTTTYDNGAATSIPNRVGGCGNLSLGLVLPKLSLDLLTVFRLDSVFAAQRCVDGGLAGQVVVPANLYLPDQNIGPFCLGSITAGSGSWSLALADTAATGSPENISMIFGEVPVSVVQSAGPAGILGSLQFQEIGFIKDESVPTSPTSGRTVSLDSQYPATLTVNFGGTPLGTDVVGFTTADYLGANGTGPLGLLGVAITPYDSGSSVLAIRNSNLAGASAPLGVRRLASVIARYLEPAVHPSVPANRVSAQTAVLLRDDGTGGPPFGTTNATTSVGDFLGLAGTTFTGPGSFTWENATANGNAPLYSTHELTVRRRSYLPVLSCATTNEVRESFEVQWVVVRPFVPNCAAGQECFVLPTLPASFPRAVAGPQQRSGFEQRLGSGAVCGGPGDCIAGEGCVDPDGPTGSGVQMCMRGSGTSADPYAVEDYAWKLHVYDLELAPAFDFDAFELSRRLDWMSHESSNTHVFN